MTRKQIGERCRQARENLAAAGLGQVVDEIDAERSRQQALATNMNINDQLNQAQAQLTAAGLCKVVDDVDAKCSKQRAGKVTGMHRWRSPWIYYNITCPWLFDILDEDVDMKPLVEHLTWSDAIALMDTWEKRGGVTRRHDTQAAGIPTPADVARRIIVTINRLLDINAWRIDVRLRVHDGSWELLYGDPSFDSDLRGWWGLSTIRIAECAAPASRHARTSVLDPAPDYPVPATIPATIPAINPDSLDVAISLVDQVEEMASQDDFTHDEEG
jgi:hypothetical protein